MNEIWPKFVLFCTWAANLEMNEFITRTNINLVIRNSRYNYTPKPLYSMSLMCASYLSKTNNDDFPLRIRKALSMTQIRNIQIAAVFNKRWRVKARVVWQGVTRFLKVYDSKGVHAISLTCWHIPWKSNTTEVLPVLK